MYSMGGLNKSRAVFSSKRQELSAYDSCLLWRNQFVVSSQGLKAILGAS